MGQNPGITIFTQYNDIPGLTMEMSLTKHKIFPIITIKSILQTTEMLIYYNKNNFYYINNDKLQTVFDMF